MLSSFSLADGVSLSPDFKTALAAALMICASGTQIVPKFDPLDLLWLNARWSMEYRSWNQDGSSRTGA